MRRIKKVAQISSLLAIVAALAACTGKGIEVKDVPEDMNVSPRSQGAYDAAYRELENNPVGGDKPQEQKEPEQQ